MSDGKAAIMKDESGGRGESREIHLSDLLTNHYNPFTASAEELLANALDDAGLVGADTTINDQHARAFLDSFYLRREAYRETTRLGSILVKQGVLDEGQLKKALGYQREHGQGKLGEALLELDICSLDDIEKSLDAQVQIRADIEDIEDFRKRINMLKERVRTYL